MKHQTLLFQTRIYYNTLNWFSYIYKDKACYITIVLGLFTISHSFCIYSFLYVRTKQTSKRRHIVGAFTSFPLLVQYITSFVCFIKYVALLHSNKALTFIQYYYPHIYNQRYYFIINLLFLHANISNNSFISISVLMHFQRNKHTHCRSKSTDLVRFSTNNKFPLRDMFTIK